MIIPRPLRPGCAVLTGLFFTFTLAAAPLVVTDQPRPGGTDFPLVAGQRVAEIWIDNGDAKVVKIAAGCLADDVERVTRLKPTLREVGTAAPAGPVVLIGTLGQSKLIDALTASGKLSAAGIREKWESCLITTVADPLPGVPQALVIVGSDRRGTAYGVFTLSEAIGVSPWYWWADAIPAPRPGLAVAAGEFVQGPPAVKYRGVFINDEDWSLQPWAAKTFEPETGDIGPKTYAKFFELVLRLRGNLIWPAMHHCTQAFNHYPANKQVADDYAMVMGSSHCEQMLRNNVGEYDEKKLGPWNYETNRDNILTYWRQRLEENGRLENIYTIGMRGIHDGGMPGGGTREEKVARLQRVIGDQRELISATIQPDAAKVPQIFCPYKEVLELYQNGLKVPDDVCIVWPDDNHGHIRQLPDAAEQQRAGGGGIYYHASYWGAPEDYLWLGTTPPSLIWEEMSRAYAFNVRNLWVLNIGGLKKTEIAMDFFLHLAWDIDAARPATAGNGVLPVAFSQKEALRQFSERTFGPSRAGEIAAILDEYYRLNTAAKPEHLFTAPVQFSLGNYGEAAERSARFAALVKRADALFASLEPRLQDAFYELVAYPVRCSALRNEVFLNARRHDDLQKKGKSSEAEEYAAQARLADARIAEETRHYNEEIAGGKWRRAVDANPRKIPGLIGPQVPEGPLAKAASPSAGLPPILTGPRHWIERDGVVSIPADEPARVINRGSGKWSVIEGLGRSRIDNAVSVLPANQPGIAPGQIASDAPELEYDFTQVSPPGAAEVIIHALPTLAVSPLRDLRYAVAIDDGTPQVVSLQAGPEKIGVWSENVLRAAALGHSKHTLHGKEGRHTVHVWSLDPGVVLEKIVIDLGGLKPSVQGPPFTAAEDRPKP